MVFIMFSDVRWEGGIPRFVDIDSNVEFTNII